MSDCIAFPYADAMLIKLPNNFSIHQASCLTCNVADAYRCVAPQLVNNPTAPVFITGGVFNNIALYSIAIAKFMGSIQVDAFGLSEVEFDKAEKVGGRIIIHKRDVPENHYPIAVDASQRVEMLHLAVEATAPAGVLTASTMYTADFTPLPLMEMFKKCLTFNTGQPDVRAIVIKSMELVLNNLENFDHIVDEILRWHDAPVAFAQQHGKRVLVREN